MYLNHYGLREKPFELTSDRRYIWLNDSNRSALASFEKAFAEDGGFMLLSGGVGVGKTTFMSCLRQALAQRAMTAVVQHPDVSGLEFLNLLSLEFSMNERFENGRDFMTHYASLAENAFFNHRKLLIVVDEAQQLKAPLCHVLNRLASLKLNGRYRTSVLLLIQGSGSNRQPPLVHLKQVRVTARYHLEALSREDALRLIAHRLQTAGAAAPLFSAEALDEIFSFSGGNPRLINLVCDRALLTGYSEDLREINDSIVQECARELQIAN
jgi:general secretion pathway protein A